MAHPEASKRVKETSPYQEIHNRIKTSLTKELKEHNGQLVLMVVRSWEPYNFDMREERREYNLNEDYCLGVITPPYLQIKNQQIIVMTKENVNVRFSTGRLHGEIKREEGPITHWNAHEMLLDASLSSKLVPFIPDKKSLEIVIGNQNVAAWIEKEVTEGRMPSTFLELEKTSPLRDRYFNDDLFIVFQRMYRTLGERLVLSEGVTQKADERLNKAKTKILISINKLLQREDQLTGRIRSTFDFVEQGGGVQVGGGILVKSEENARVETMGLRKGLEEIREKIGSELKRAFELGMHETEMTIETEIRPGYKEILDVKRFILGLCQYYEIPIPSSS